MIAAWWASGPLYGCGASFGLTFWYLVPTSTVLGTVAISRPTESQSRFAVAGQKLHRLVAAALNDILTPSLLHDALTSTIGENEVAQLFSPDRENGSNLDTQSIHGLSNMSHREYVYEPDGEVSELRLRQQSWLGVGLRIEAAQLR